MKRAIILLILFALALAAYQLTRDFYISVDDKGYDILLTNKNDSEAGYGIYYRRGIGVWRFWRAGYGGVRTQKVWPAGKAGKKKVTKKGAFR
ncbi:hypothetical protein ACFL42_02870 [Candidatus Omnitrophota bacterium]